MSKAILVIDVDDLDIEKTQAISIELKCGDCVSELLLVNHWLMPMPEKKEILDIRDTDDMYDVFANKINVGFNRCIDEIVGAEE